MSRVTIKTAGHVHEGLSADFDLDFVPRGHDLRIGDLQLFFYGDALEELLDLIIEGMAAEHEARKVAAKVDGPSEHW